MNRLCQGLSAGVLLAEIVVVPALAQDPTLPTFRSFAGAFLVADDHNLLVESELRLPLWAWGPLHLYYRYRDTTPFLDLSYQIQAELLYSRYEMQVDWVLNDQLRLIGGGGYHNSELADRAGYTSSYVVGAGLGSPLRPNGSRLSWSALAGAFIDQRDLDGQWWADVEGSWRLFDFVRDEYLGSNYRASLALAGLIESVNAQDRFRAVYRLGPELQLLTATGNRANLDLQWYRNDHQPFYGREENGLLLGLHVVSAREDDYLWNARTDRQPGVFPLVWGEYNFGMTGERRLQRFEMNVELVDFIIAERRLTGFVWYELRQEHWITDLDNVCYSVSLGLQTPIGLASPLSHGDPLVVGLDFLHRSDHALNADRSRVAEEGELTPIGPVLPNGSLNLLPRLRLQTIGWDLPYRDPTMYERRIGWLHLVDWRITAGYDSNSTRARSDFAGQLGVNWDVATLQGYVVYLRGLGSVGNETPDWSGEIGIRRPAGKLFLRWEDYGLHPSSGEGEVALAGIGVYL